MQNKSYNSRYKYSPYSGCLGRNTGCIIEARLFLFDLRQYRIILSADTASEVRQLLGQKRR